MILAMLFAVPLALAAETQHLGNHEVATGAEGRDVASGGHHLPPPDPERTPPHGIIEDDDGDAEEGDTGGPDPLPPGHPNHGRRLVLPIEFRAADAAECVEILKERIPSIKGKILHHRAWGQTDGQLKAEDWCARHFPRVDDASEEGYGVCETSPCRGNSGDDQCQQTMRVEPNVTKAECEKHCASDGLHLGKPGCHWRRNPGGQKINFPNEGSGKACNMSFPAVGQKPGEGSTIPGLGRDECRARCKAAHVFETDGATCSWRDGDMMEELRP